MAEERKLGAAYVQILTKGMDTVKTDLAKVKTGFNETVTAVTALKKIGENVNIKVNANIEGALASINEMQTVLQNTPASIRLTLDTARSNLREQTKKELEKLPRSQKIRILTERIEAAKGQVEKAKSAVAKDPGNKVAQAELKYSQGVLKDLKKEKLAVIFSPITNAITSALVSFNAMADAMNKVGAVAQRAFVGGAAAIGGFIRAADPVGVDKLSGTIGQIAVQLGSIFIPILDKVRAGLDKVLAFLRQLNNAQKDQIVRWTMLAGAVALSLAVLPKVIGLIQGAAIAIKVLGIATGLASGGLLPILATLAAVAAGFALFNASTEQGTGVLGTMMEKVKPLADALMSFGKEAAVAFAPALQVLLEVGNIILDVVVVAFKKLGPIVLQVAKVVIAAVSSILKAARPIFISLGAVLKTVITVATNLAKALQPVFESLVSAIVESFQGLAPIISGVVNIIDGILTALIPIVTIVADGISVVITSIIKTFQLLVAIFAPGFKVLADLVVNVADIFASAWESIFGEFESFGGVFEKISNTIVGFFDMMIEGVKMLQPVFSTVFGFIKNIVMGVAKAMLYVAALAKEIARGNFTGAFSAANKAVKDFEERVNEREKKREKKVNDDLEVGHVGGVDWSKPLKKEEGRHTPLAQQKVELVGFSELWRRAQQATVESPEQKMQQERLRLGEDQLKATKDQTEILKQIRDEEVGDRPAVFGQ